MTQYIKASTTGRTALSGKWGVGDLRKRPQVFSGRGVYEIKLFADDEDVIIPTEPFEWMIPPDLDEAGLVEVYAFVSTVSSGDIELMLVKEPVGGGGDVDMLQSNLTIASGNKNSSLTTGDDIVVVDMTVEAGDHLRFDVIDPGSGALGLGVIVVFVPGSIYTVTVQGSQGAAGASGTPGGITAFNGQWTTATGYVFQDSVSNNGSSYAAIDNHTSGATSEPGVGANWEDHWQLLAEGGTSGAIPETLIDAKGDLIVGTAADTVARLAAGTNGQILYVDSGETTGLKWDAAPTGGGGGGADMFWSDAVVKQADETVTSSTTLQDDNEIQFSITGSVPYYFELIIVFDSAAGSAVPDFKHAFALSTGTFSRGWRGYEGLGATSATAQQTIVGDMTSAIGHASASEKMVNIVRGYFQASADATLHWQWAQNTSDANGITVRAGTVMRLRDMTQSAPIELAAEFHGVRVSETTDQAITTGATGETITFSAEGFDTDDYHSTSSNTDRLVVPSGLAGYYHITGQVRWDAQTAGTYRRVRIFSSSSAVALAETLMEPETSGWSGHNLSADYFLNVGDYVTLVADHDRGSDLNVKASFAPSILQMHRITSTELGSTNIDGWTSDDNTWTYASATTFTVSGDQTLKFSKGTRIKLTQTTDKYFVVVASSHSAGTTTVTITGGTTYTFANAAVTSPYYSYAENPQGYPASFAYTPTWTQGGGSPAISNGTLSAVFSVAGSVCTYSIYLVGGSTTNWGTGANPWVFSYPIAEDSTNEYALGLTMCFDSSASAYRWSMNRAGSIFTNSGTGAAGFWHTTVPVTWATSDIMSYKVVYRF